MTLHDAGPAGLKTWFPMKSRVFVATLAFGAGAVVTLLAHPGSESAARMTERAEPAECAGQTWPYFDQACRDAKAAAAPQREVRIVSGWPTRSVATEETKPAASSPTQGASTPSPPSPSVTANSAPEPAAAPPMLAAATALATTPPPVVAPPAVSPPARTMRAQAPDPEPSSAASSRDDDDLAATPPPARRIARDTDRIEHSRSGRPMMLVQTYDTPDGRRVIVRHRLSRAEVESMGYASSRPARRAPRGYDTLADVERAVRSLPFYR